MGQKDFEKLPHILGNLEGHANVRVWMHVRKTPKKNLCSLLWLKQALCEQLAKSKEKLQIFLAALLKKISIKFYLTTMLKEQRYQLLTRQKIQTYQN